MLLETIDSCPVTGRWTGFVIVVCPVDKHVDLSPSVSKRMVGFFGGAQPLNSYVRFTVVLYDHAEKCTRIIQFWEQSPQM